METLLAVVAPHRCKGCNAEGTLLCADCASGITRRPPTCYNCNRQSEAGRTCVTCQRQSDLAGVTVAANYDGVAKELVHALKYHQQVAACKSLAGLMTPRLSSTDYDLVTAIPGAPSRYRHRGYHQAELIAKRVARQLGLPYRQVLRRLEVESQVGAGRSQRLARVQGSFWVYHPRSISGQRLLLIDDVLTTGATLAEAAKVLKSAGAQSVWGAVAAKH